MMARTLQRRRHPVHDFGGPTAVWFGRAKLLLRHGGETVMEINPQPTPFTPEAHHILTGLAGVVLPQLLASPEK
jgi:hypothetical protein